MGNYNFIKISPSIFISLFILLSACGGNKTAKTVQKEDGKGKKVVHIARSYIGAKYKYGAADKKRTDCSGLTTQVYEQVGVVLPRSSSAQPKIGQRVYIGELRPGDLIFFGSKPSSKRVSHVGIISYAKGDYIKMIHASSSRGVVEDKIDEHYWRQRYIRASRPLSTLKK